MSQSSNERLKEETSSFEQDEGDSGHDSVDDMSSPADERERIASLETAVAWIREEVVSENASCERRTWSAPCNKGLVVSLASEGALCVNIVPVVY